MATPSGSARIFNHLVDRTLREKVLAGEISQERYWLMRRRGNSLNVALNPKDLKYSRRYLRRPRAMGGLFPQEQTRRKAVKQAKQVIRRIQRPLRLNDAA